MKSVTFFMGIIVLLFIGCESDSLLNNTSDDVVIRAYLYADEAVCDIQISKALSLGSEETSMPPVNDADVSLMKNGQEYQLVLSAGDSGYYNYAGNDLSVEAGDIFTLRVVCENKTITAETSVPAAPVGVKCSSDTLFVPESFEPWSFELDTSRHQIRCAWDAGNNQLFYVVMENQEENPDSVDTTFPLMGGPGMNMRSQLNLTTNSEYIVDQRGLQALGLYKITIFTVNEEYMDLYISRQQDSRDLNEPLTNVENGLGIFSAFNKAAVSFVAVYE